MFYYRTLNDLVLIEIEFLKGIPINTWKEFHSDGYLEITGNLNNKVNCNYYENNI
jgi:hypothetical protein